MIGLQYILELYQVQQSDLANELGIKRQNINIWLNEKQDISKKHLPALSKKFNIPEQYFQKELTKEDIEKINEMKEYSRTKVGKGLKHIRLYYVHKVVDVIRQLEVDAQTYIRWEKGLEIIPSDKVKQLSKIYDIEEEFIVKDLYHDDYIALWEILFKKDVKNGRLASNDKGISDEKIVFLNSALNSLEGKKVYISSRIGGISFDRSIEYLTNSLFSEGHEKLFFIKDKFSTNAISFLAYNIRDIDVDLIEECIIKISFGANSYFTISTRQDTDLL